MNTILLDDKANKIFFRIEGVTAMLKVANDSTSNFPSSAPIKLGMSISYCLEQIEAVTKASGHLIEFADKALDVDINLMIDIQNMWQDFAKKFYEINDLCSDYAGDECPALKNVSHLIFHLADNVGDIQELIEDFMPDSTPIAA